MSFVPALAFDAVHHAYGRTTALAGVSLAIRPGEVVALLGPSGCGKTTLLRIAAGLERPSRGRVSAGDRPLAGDGIFVQPEKRGIGLMFQDYALFPHLDVAANLAFGLAGWPEGIVRATVADLLARIGLTGRERAYPHMLSGGEQQRVALARAMAPRPAVLLMDEPFSNLDQRLRRGMRSETIGLLRATGAAALMVTHDPDDAMAVADRIALMRGGRIVQVGTPEEVWHRPVDRWAAAFFADLEEMPARVRNGRAETPLGSFAAPGLADGSALVCLRRDAFDLAAADPEFAATVLSARFIGEHRTVRLAIDGLERPVDTHVDAKHALEVGGRVAVGIDRSQAFVFAEEECDG
ncbi:MAG: ABC transporter ATP-binding protein [Siculibacillus sp.]|nr:ABC transporter ATP-binding protein [Siculibacillus sp.]